jgi:hypothetical protein
MTVILQRKIYEDYLWGYIHNYKQFPVQTNTQADYIYRRCSRLEVHQAFGVYADIQFNEASSGYSFSERVQFLHPFKGRHNLSGLLK